MDTQKNEKRSFLPLRRTDFKIDATDVLSRRRIRLSTTEGIWLLFVVPNIDFAVLVFIDTVADFAVFVELVLINFAVAI